MQNKRITGRFEQTSISGEEVKAFIPYPLPPSNPSLSNNFDELMPGFLKQIDQQFKLLQFVSSISPVSAGLLIYSFVRKEAVLSSQIEGTQATLIDLFNSEVDETLLPNADVEEICNYISALKFAREQLADPNGLPLSMRLMNQVHKRLMQGVRGQNKLPGEIRRSQNWIGGTRPGNAMYVPPPPHVLQEVLSDFEKYMHTEDALHPIIRAGLLHAQFETIHPYLDGNGRMGRLLVTMLLEHWKLLPQPFLHLSLYLKQHRDEYYRRLNAIRTEGDWEGWLKFFVLSVCNSLMEVNYTITQLKLIVETNRIEVLQHQDSSILAMRLFEQLIHHPIVNIESVMKLIDTSKPTAIRTVEILTEIGILKEMTGKKRDRRYKYDRYLEILSAGTELN